MGTVPRIASVGAPPQVAPEFCAEVVVGLSQPGQKSCLQNICMTRSARLSSM